ncbi:methyltransferase family protein [Halobacillus yeomjeoni]|uniref:Isoprenylcysteine carboxylmethyltransferase family protein n=1 Tax=Halobacillus yeomjeoni TaxID=311194 RepID=A0A931HXW6_9BACI|nr:isoprenylcysteine carboxylmethyltransferase family protein [Halobacillus yeomjeoni]MBH0231632.1 isoprenylcysteine carboxylmethyltransferase family protein [Halobacillus yeomjeoni]
MTLYEILFLSVTALWVGEFLVFRNQNSREGGQLERKSYSIILVAVVATVVLTLGMREIDLWVVTSAFVWWAGLLLYTIGVFLRYWGIIHLKDQFTRDVSVRKGDRLVSSGPYRKLRHPLYTGLFFIVIGFCLGVGSLLGALIFGFVTFNALLHRIRIEEAMLVEGHGDMYVNWCKSRYRLIPFVY